MTVVVTDAHTRMALAVIRELGRAGYDVTAVTLAGTRPLGHASRYTRAAVTLPREGYAERLLDMAGAGRPVLLAAGKFTLEAAAERYSDFTAAFRCLLPEADCLRNAGDKPTVAAFAHSLGLNVPDEYPGDNPRFPCVIKYRDGEALGLKAEARYAVARTKQEWDAAFPRMRALGEVFVSQYVMGEARGVSFVLGDDSAPLAAFCHRRVREYPLSGGPACCAVSIRDEGLLRQAHALVKALRLRGFAMVEFKGDYVLEVNPRVWGSYPLSALCGAGMAEAYARGACGEDAHARPSAYKVGVKMQYGANDLAHFAAALRQGRWASGVGVLADLLNPCVKAGVWDRRDWRGSWAYTRGLLAKGYNTT